MQETLEQLVARVNSLAFVPPPNPTGGVMAKAVKLAKGKEFTFAPSGRGGGLSKYPWDEWFNGSLLLIERTVYEADDVTVVERRDYDVPTNTMVPKIKAAARKRYKVCQVSRRDEHGQRLGDALIIRARDMSTDERISEDLLRAEEKAARAAAAEENGAEETQSYGDDVQS